MLSPIAWRTPPRHYGPWETVVHNLTEGLVARGHEVTLFATGDSITSARLRWICARPYEEDQSIDGRVWTALHSAFCFEHADEFDIIHNHFDWMPLTYSRLVATPVITTIHGFSSPKLIPAYAAYNGHVAYVAISHADRHPALDYVATVYNGIALSQFTFNPRGGDYLVFIGRLDREKGPDLAIRVAQATGRRLVIAGIVTDREFFDRELQPHIDGERIRFIGSVGPQARDELLGNALASLHLVTRPERFGLTIVEALACGTPVIGTGLGSVAELLNAAVGAVVGTVEEAAEAVDRVGRLRRADCRRHVEDHFTVDRMVEGYLRAYRAVLAGRERNATASRQVPADPRSRVSQPLGDTREESKQVESA